MSGLVQDSSALASAAQRRVPTRPPSGPRNRVGRPATPTQRSPVTGWSMTPISGRSPSSSATSEPNIGRPVMKARVPSIGSSTQRSVAAGLFEAVLFPENAVARAALGQHAAHGLLGAPVGDGDRALVVLAVGIEAAAEMWADHRTRGIRRRLRGRDELG